MSNKEGILHLSDHKKSRSSSKNLQIEMMCGLEGEGRKEKTDGNGWMVVHGITKTGIPTLHTAFMSLILNQGMIV